MLCFRGLGFRVLRACSVGFGSWGLGPALNPTTPRHGLFGAGVQRQLGAFVLGLGGNWASVLGLGCRVQGVGFSPTKGRV